MQSASAEKYTRQRQAAIRAAAAVFAEKGFHGACTKDIASADQSFETKLTATVTSHLSYFGCEFHGTFQTAVEIREDIAARGREKVVALQARNPMHLAHEELCRMAMDHCRSEIAGIPA